MGREHRTATEAVAANWKAIAETSGEVLFREADFRTECDAAETFARNFRKAKADVSIWQQFANAADLQKWWSDNMVSCTVTFKEEEAGQIVDCLDHFQDRLKSISLLPISDHGYEQAPYIQITADQYEELVRDLRPLDLSGNTHEVDDKFCSGDKCTVFVGEGEAE